MLGVILTQIKQVSWLTHSSPQFFEPIKWSTFQLVHKANRAKVALALEFDSIVIGILSNDLLVQVSLDVVCYGDRKLTILSVSVGGSRII